MTQRPSLKTVEQRKKNTSLFKQTDVYRRYAVAKHPKLSVSKPPVDNPRRPLSVRNWNGQWKAWKRAVYEWDRQQQQQQVYQDYLEMRCHVCALSEPEWVCGKCLQFFYCSKACQQHHWDEEHERNCGQ